MGAFTQAADVLLRFIVQFGVIVGARIRAFELWLRTQLDIYGVPAQVQSVILLVVAILLIFAVLRLLGGLMRIALVLILLVITAFILLPIVGR